MAIELKNLKPEQKQFIEKYALAVNGRPTLNRLASLYNQVGNVDFIDPKKKTRQVYMAVEELLNSYFERNPSQKERYLALGLDRNRGFVKSLDDKVVYDSDTNDPVSEGSARLITPRTIVEDCGLRMFEDCVLKDALADAGYSQSAIRLYLDALDEEPSFPKEYFLRLAGVLAEAKVYAMIQGSLKGHPLENAHPIRAYQDLMKVLRLNKKSGNEKQNDS